MDFSTASRHVYYTISRQLIPPVGLGGDVSASPGRRLFPQREEAAAEIPELFRFKRYTSTSTPPLKAYLHLLGRGQRGLVVPVPAGMDPHVDR